MEQIQVKLVGKLVMLQQADTDDEELAEVSTLLVEPSQIDDLIAKLQEAKEQAL